MLSRRREFCAVSDQSLDFLSHNEHLQKTIFLLSAQFKTIYEYKQMEQADLGKHCLLLHKPGFPQMTSHIEADVVIYI